jgi:streptogramin lyase
MNDHSNSRYSAPQPMCAALEPLLPLLSLGKLEPDEAAMAREHVTTCDYCQSEFRDFEAVRDAVRQHGVPVLSAEPAVSEAVPVLTLAAILATANRDDGDEDEERAGHDGHVAAPLAAPRPSPTPVHMLRRGWGRWTGHGALAAALLLALLAGALFRWHAGPAAGILVPRTEMPIPGLGTLTKFSLPTAGSHPSDIVAGRDGNVWFTEDGGGGRIGCITPWGVVAEFPLPTPLRAGLIFDGLAAGPDGNIWYTDDASGIGRLSPPDGKITEFALTTRDVFPVFIVAGPDGNIWFGAEPPTGDYPGKIGRITPGGAITEFPLPDATPYVNGLAAGPDGNIWFNSSGSGDNRIGRMSTAGAVTWFSVPLSFTWCKCQRSLISAGPDGNIWYFSPERTQDPNVFRVRIARISPRGDITEFPLPGNLATVATGGPMPPLAARPDGNVWFVAGAGHTLGRITPQGAITTFALPSGVALYGITLGPDGTLWFTDPEANMIDRLQLNGSGWRSRSLTCGNSRPPFPT